MGGMPNNYKLNSSTRHGQQAQTGFRTWCKLCPAAIYRDQPAVWLTDPMGLSHAACADAVIDVTTVDGAA